jgi:ParB-like chromosome segregation protein Spo0J
MSNKLEITFVSPGKLKAYGGNPRINDHAVDKMVQVIKGLGFKVPILVTPDYEIIDGHLRYKAAVKANLEEVPISIVDDLNETQIKALRIEINKSAEWAQWDEDLLAIELGDLVQDDFDLSLTGFDEEEVAGVLEGLDVDLDFSPNINPEAPDPTNVTPEHVYKAKRKLGGQHKDKEYLAEHVCPACGHKYHVAK